VPNDPQNRGTAPQSVAASHPFEEHQSSLPQRSNPRPDSRLDDALAFLRGFMAQPMSVASVVPSSPYLEQAVVRATDLSRARCVVELGPGTGGSTRALLRAMNPQARLLAIELNPEFASRLRQRVQDPRLLVQEGSAAEIGEHLERWSLPAPDAVVSGIPFSTLPTEVAHSIVAAIQANLAPGGRFVAYQFRAHVASYTSPVMGEPSFEWEWRNVPPMRVFRWVKR